nr:2Fe-2S iron-sulfur cluster-binding protein [Bryobacter sp.]
MSRPIEFPGGPGLREFLFAQGVEFPCNGESQCGQCRVRLLRGDIPVTDAMRAVLRDEELAAGWRLGCEAEAAGPLTVAVEQWAPVILTDEAHVTHVPQPGLAVAVDLGTTTMVAQLLDRTTG